MFGVGAVQHRAFPLPDRRVEDEAIAPVIRGWRGNAVRPGATSQLPALSQSSAIGAVPVPCALRKIARFTRSVPQPTGEMSTFTSRKGLSARADAHEGGGPDGPPPSCASALALSPFLDVNVDISPVG